MAEPTCIITGHIAGHPLACGDCDPCSAANSVSPEVKRLITELDEWMDRYSSSASDLDEALRLLQWARGCVPYLSDCHRAIVRFVEPK